MEKIINKNIFDSRDLEILNFMKKKEVSLDFLDLIESELRSALI